MSFNWDSVEQREQKRMANEKNLHAFLIGQQIDDKKRKQWERQKELEDSRRLLAEPNIYQLNFSKQPNYQQNQGPNQTYSLPAKASPKLPTSTISSEFASIPSTMMTVRPDGHSETTSISLRYLEGYLNLFLSSKERLEHEVKAREHLDAELRSGKNVMAQLNAKIEQLQTQLVNSSSRPIAEPSDMVRFEVKKDIERITDNTSSRFSQLLSEQMALKSQVSHQNETQAKKYRSVIDEVDQLKHLLSSYITKTSDLHQDHSAKENMLITENAKMATVAQIVGGHDQFIQSFHKKVETKFGQFEMVFQTLKQEYEHLIQNEQVMKQGFEQLVKDTALDVIKNVQSKISLMEGSITSSLSTAKELAEARQVEYEKIMGYVREQSQDLVLKLVDVKQQNEENLKNKMRSFEEWITAEATNSSRREYQIKSDFDKSLKSVEAKVAHDIVSTKEDLKLKISSSTKTIQHSMHVIEETTSLRFEKLEKVVKAEIEQRIEQQKRYEAEISRLNEQVQLTQSKVVEIKAVHSSDNDKIKARIETVQQNLKEVILNLTDNTNNNRVSISHLQKAFEEIQVTIRDIEETEKKTITQQIEVQLGQIKNTINQIYYSFGEIQNKSNSNEEKINNVEIEIGKYGGFVSALESVRDSVDAIERWKMGIPEQLVSKSNFDEYTIHNNQILEHQITRIKEIDSIISTSNILKTVDLVQEFTRLQSKVHQDHSYLKEHLSRLGIRVEQTLTVDLFEKKRELIEGRISQLDEKQKSVISEISGIQKTLESKVERQQWDLIDVHVKNLRETLGTLSVWVQDNSTKQSNDIHALLMDIQKGLLTRQLDQVKAIEETKKHLDRRIDGVSINVHDIQQANKQTEIDTISKIKLGEEEFEVKLSTLRSNFAELSKTNMDRLDQVESHIEHLKSTMQSYVSEKLIPLATKTELQMFDSGIQILASELKQLKDHQRVLFDQMKHDIDMQVRKLQSPSNDASAAQEIKTLREAFRSLTEQSEQKYSRYLGTVNDLGDRLVSLELKSTSEGMNAKFNDGKLLDMTSQIRDIESAIRQTPFTPIQPFGASNIYKPDMKPRSTTASKSRLANSNMSIGSSGSQPGLFEREESESGPGMRIVENEPYPVEENEESYENEEQEQEQQDEQEQY